MSRIRIGRRIKAAGGKKRKSRKEEKRKKEGRRKAYKIERSILNSKKQRWMCNEGDDQIRMKKFATDLGISILLLLSSTFLGCCTAAISGLSTALAGAVGNVGGTPPMHKVQLTQKGYIQVRNARDNVLNSRCRSFSVGAHTRSLVMFPRKCPNNPN